MAKIIRGVAKLDNLTKRLVQRLAAGDIAIIDHQDIDRLSAKALCDKKVAAVLNASVSFSGRFPNLGALVLLENNIYVLDNLGAVVFESISEGDLIEIDGDKVYRAGKVIAQGIHLTYERYRQLLELAERQLNSELQKFVENTLSYLSKEKMLLWEPIMLTKPLKTKMVNKNVVVVVRGEGYKEDLATLDTFIKAEQPVLIGVDGGADALLERGWKPHIIVGDMDSVSDSALRAAAELVVHAYPNLEAPGLRRVSALCLEAKLLSVPGTSEDAALLLAYESGANLIVAIGTHYSLLECLEKGRPGIASTFLVRLRVGDRLIDAKGVSKLYRRRIKFRYIALMLLAAVSLCLAIIVLSPRAQQFLEILGLVIRTAIK